LTRAELPDDEPLAGRVDVHRAARRRDAFFDSCDSHF
jgi:hypothetical protein